MFPRLLPLVVAALVTGAATPLCAPAAPAPRDEVLELPIPTSAAVASATPAATPRPTTVQGMRIAIPRLGIDLPLEDGSVERDVPRDGYPGGTPEGAAFHFPGTALPGERGNAYIYSHARVGMFLALWDIRAGDEVIVRTPEGAELRYVVVEVRSRVPARDVSWLGPTEDERLTLQTSTGARPEDPRFIAVARRIG